MEMLTIDLNQYKVNGSKVFTGRDRGRSVREQSNIDKLAKGIKKISIIIPIDIYSINPSFLEEFLTNVVTLLGKENFMQKFEFVNEGDYKIYTDLEEAIDRIIRPKNALI